MSERTDHRPTDSTTVADVADRYWKETLAAAPTSATLLGIHEHDDRLEDLSVDSEMALRGRFERLAAELTTLSPSAVDDKVTATLLDHQLRTAIEAIDLRLVEMASDQMLGPHASLLMSASQMTYPTAADATAALTRYAQVPRMLGQALDRFRDGLAAGRTPATAVIARSINSLEQYLATPLADDPFLAPGLPTGLAGSDGPDGSSWDGTEAWRSDAAALVRDVIRPSFAMYLGVLRDELAPAGRDDEHAGWCHLPDGDAMYDAVVRAHTTLDLSPQELHDMGRDLTEQVLPAEYVELGAEVFATSDLQEIFDRLRNDPALRHRDAADVVDVATATVARATAAMDDWFGRLPGSPCVVTAVPDFLAADAPYAYYYPPAVDGTRGGTYFINTANPTESSRTEAESIAFHEAIPGHHLQIAISQELDGLPEFQRHDGATSYIEGWGLYAERLADEMGLYSGPLDRLGMLTADSWRSARLVVDTGLHALGWSRQQAVDYFVTHTPVPVDQVLAEVDRYLAMPGQALSYKVGQLHIQRLREEAAERLGDEFQIADFHDVVLGSGAVTLPVLSDLVRRFVEERCAG